MRSCLISAFVLATCCSMCLADAPGILNFQGKLTTNAGVNVPDGAHTVRFSIYNGPAGNLAVTNEATTFQTGTGSEVDAFLAHGGIVPNSETVQKSDGTVTYGRGTAYSINNATGVLASLGSPAIIPSGTAVIVTYQWVASSTWTETEVVKTSKGLFATTLGLGTPIPTAALTGSDWMQVEVQNTDHTFDSMLPRQRLAAAPYALGLALPFNASVTGVTSDPLLSLTTSAGESGPAVLGQSIGLPGIGVEGAATSPYGVGVLGTSDTGDGVFARSGTGSGVSAYSAYGDGVIADAGVYGVEAAGKSAGVHGFSYSGNGVYAETNSSNACGLYGKNNAGGASVIGYCPSTGYGVGLFAGDLGSFGQSAIETNLSASGTHIWCGENSNPVFYVGGGGAVHAVSYGYFSDSRYKKSIRTVANPLASIEGLRGVSFEWNPATGRSFPKGRQIGFVAQEVRKVLPELVSEDEKGYLSVEYANVVPVLVEAIKAQQKQITDTTRTNARLRTQNAQVQARLCRLEAQVRALASGSQHPAGR